MFNFQGVPIKPGRHRDSILSSNPLTDTQVIREMQEADKRSKIIADQMEEIKQQLEELKNVSCQRYDNENHFMFGNIFYLFL